MRDVRPASLEREAGRKTHHQGLFPFLLVPVLTQALLALVRGNLMTFAFATAGHMVHLIV